MQRSNIACKVCTLESSAQLFLPNYIATFLSSLTCIHVTGKHSINAMENWDKGACISQMSIRYVCGCTYNA